MKGSQAYEILDALQLINRESHELTEEERAQLKAYAKKYGTYKYGDYIWMMELKQILCDLQNEKTSKEQK